MQALRQAHEDFKKSLSVAEQDYKRLGELDHRIKAFNVSPNPYTWFTIESLEETWHNLQKIISDRDQELIREEDLQRENDMLRQEFAMIANDFHGWLEKNRNALMEGAGSLEDQLENIKLIAKQIMEQRTRLRTIEELGAKLAQKMIMDNRFSILLLSLLYSYNIVESALE